MRSALLIALGFLLLVLESSLATLVPVHAVAPNLLLPLAIYLGVTHEIPLVRGAGTSFVLGYLLDTFCGNTMGLHTFVLSATFMVARGAGLRLFLRGPAFQIVSTFVVALAAFGTILALRAIFEANAIPTSVWDEPVGVAGGLEVTARLLLVPALVTALVSPPLFAVVRRIEAIGVRRSEQRNSIL